MRSIRSLLLILCAALPLAAQSPFSLTQVMGAPYPANLTTSAAGERIAWTVNERGLRNVYVAEGPAFVARRLTSYVVDDGQELTALSISPDGKWVVYVRGGDFSSNFDDALPVNPLGTPIAPRVEMWIAPFAGGQAVSLGDGLNPIFSPRSDAIVFERGGQLWSVPIDGRSPARRLFTLRGSNGGAEFSPDGNSIAFVSSRGDHAFIGIYRDTITPIKWIAPSTNRDWSPRWSTDGSRLVFARRAGSGGAPASVLALSPSPWSIWTYDLVTDVARERWKSEVSLRGSVPSTDGGVNLHWAFGNRITFLSYHDGWPHLYSMLAMGTEAPTLLSPEDHMAEHISLSRDGKFLLYSGNLGAAPEDRDRRHVVRVAVDRPGSEVVTPGSGLEWAPVTLASGRIVAFGATAQQPPVPFVIDGSRRRLIGESVVPVDFPAARFVTPKQVVFDSPDGLKIHASLFEPPVGGPTRKPAIVYVHGGPPRQMLLGYHYGDYYFNAYLMNQYLASRGFIVLAVNYRLGIGYGHDFHRPPKAGASGASEYMDVKAAGEWLRGLFNVDPRRIGVYGGSYGGFLTALALGRDSDLFAAGVDIHGVHDFTSDGGARFGGTTWRYERVGEDLQRAADVAWQSSPVSAVKTWKSPVLLIHADDDRNVRFNQTTDLVQRLRAQGVEFEEIVIPDDTHHFMRHANQTRVNAAIAEYFERKLRPQQ